MAFLCDVFLEDFRFRGLRIPKIHHLVEKFVNDDKIITNGFFFELFEVLREDLDDLMEEEEDFCGIGIAFGKSEEIEVGVSDVKVLETKAKG